MPKLNFYEKYRYFHGAGCEQFLTYDMNCCSPLRGSIDIFRGKYFSKSRNMHPGIVSKNKKFFGKVLGSHIKK